MKKLLLLLAVVVATAGIADAQVNSRAIGLRFDYDETQISYQHPLSDRHRVEFDLGLGYTNFFNFAGVYHWVWDLSALAPGFNWFAGIGADFRFGNKFFTPGVVGDIGLEYNFNIPIQLALDWRPGFYIAGGNPDWGYRGVAIAVRFRF